MNSIKLNKILHVYESRYECLTLKFHKIRRFYRSFSSAIFRLIGVSKRKSRRLNRISQTTDDADPFPKRPGLDTVKSVHPMAKGSLRKKKRERERKRGLDGRKKEKKRQLHIEMPVTIISLKKHNTLT